MLTLTIIMMAALMLAIEFYIYRALIAKHSLPVRIAYIAQAIVIFAAIALTMIFYRSNMIDPSFMAYSIWVIFIFFLSFSVKFFIALSLLVRFLLRKIWRGRKFNSSLWIGATLSTLSATILIYGSTYGRTSLRVEYVEIQSDKIPASFDGFRIAQFSDTHIGNYGGWTGVIEELVETINQHTPDIVIQSGDLVNIHSDELTDEFMNIFSSIKAPLYAVLGNHDLAYYIGDTSKIKPSETIDNLRTKQASMGWYLMENEGQWLRRGADSIMLAGVTFPRNHKHNGYNSVIGKSDMPTALAGVTPSDYSILIAHSPSIFDSTSRTGILPDLVISGHIHSMQMQLSCGDWKWSPAKLLYPMFSGLYTDHRGRKLYINDGIGYVLYPVRIGTRPELTIFTLRRSRRGGV